MSVVVLAVSSALLLFYIQTVCEQALKREFSQPFFREIIQAVHLEYPLLRDTYASMASLDYAQVHQALKCDFFTLQYLLKNGDPARRRLARGERMLGLYFRFLMYSMPIRHGLKLSERAAVLRMASVLQYFANSVGEKLAVNSLASAQANVNL
jgi:hypothetical protein